MIQPSAAEVTLIIVTYNSAALLEDFFAALPEALEGLSDARVVVVDNASQDDTAVLARCSSQVDEVIVLDRNRGYAAGINAGVRASGVSDTYLVLNPDVRLGYGSVATLVTGLADPDVGIAVPKLRDEHGELLWSLRRRPSLGRCFGEAVFGGRAGRWPGLGETMVGVEHYGHQQLADWATGGAMLLSRRCLEHVGLWDESFFLYEEEVEFALRAADHGFRLRLQPGADAVRIIGDDPPADELWALSRINKLRLYARRHSGPSTIVFWLLLLLGELLRSPRATSHHRATLVHLLLPFRFLDGVIRRHLVDGPPRIRTAEETRS